MRSCETDQCNQQVDGRRRFCQECRRQRNLASTKVAQRIRRAKESARNRAARAASAVLPVPVPVVAPEVLLRDRQLLDAEQRRIDDYCRGTGYHQPARVLSRQEIEALVQAGRVTPIHLIPRNRHFDLRVNY